MSTRLYERVDLAVEQTKPIIHLIAKEVWQLRTLKGISWMTATKISYATCPLCEATCGLEIETRDREIISIRGDAQDVFSHGYIL